MKYTLILWVYSGYPGYSLAITSAEFDTVAACEHAGEAATKKRGGTTWYVCGRSK